MSSLPLDQARPVRPGEEISLASLSAYLQEHVPGFAEPISVEQFASGYSNLTYLIRAGQQEWVLRRPPVGAQIKTAHDMGREFRILSALSQGFVPVPRPVHYCADPAVIGAPFYLMERVQGVILRSRLPEGVSAGPELMRQLSLALVDALAGIHQVDVHAAGLSELGKPEGYVTRQIEGWRKRYEAAKTDSIPGMERAAAWLAHNKPPESGAALIHNDFKYDNLVFDPNQWGRVTACLDWEMATLGDPWMDLGTTLGYWVEADDPEEWRCHAFGLTTLPGNLSRTELVQTYAESTGRAIPEPLFYYVYGLFKIGVIVQQIYARYKAGLTQDARFAALLQVVRGAGLMAERALDSGRISSTEKAGGGEAVTR